MRHRVRRAPPGAGPLVVVLAGLLTGGPACTVVGSDSAPAPTPTGSPRSAPTPQHRELALGEAAAVTVRVSGERARVRLAVTEVEERTTKDLAQFRLDARTRRSTPYYATVRVTKLGGGDLSGQPVTLWALGSDGTVRPPAEVLGIFRPCRSRPLPRRFAEGDSARTCLLFLMPRGTTLQAVQYRFGDRPPYSWTVG